GLWTFRRGRLYLLDGTLPVGHRLPLASLPSTPPSPCDDTGVPRTALCVEPRGGALAVFLPPLGDAGRWLALVAAIADVAATLGAAVALEGYEPPEDPRLHRIALEPDVGVLRVAVPPSASVAGHVASLAAVHDEAERIGLVAERRADDGTRELVGGGVSLV